MTVLPMQLGMLAGAGSARQPADRRTSRPNAVRRRIIAEIGEQRSQHAVDGRTDEELLSDYVAGDRGALRLLIERYQNDLLHFLTRFAGSRTAAEDVFQEAFLQVHLSAASFDPTRRFKPWLFTIAANKARDFHRKHGKHAAASLSATIGDEDGQRFVDLMEADLPDPDLPILETERRSRIKGVVDAMPAHLREILLLSYFQRMSYGQIAESLGIPLGTVKSRLHAAVAAFAKAWAAANDEGRGDKATAMEDGEG